MHYDISEQLKNSLSNMGFPPDKCQFDAHSTIEISLENMPSLYLSVISDRIWLWTALTWMDSSTLSVWGCELWEELQQALDWIITGQPVLGLGDNGYELKALVDESCFEVDGGFDELLESFFLLCERLNERFSRTG